MPAIPREKCVCDLRNRQRDPNTGICRTCGGTFERSVLDTFEERVTQPLPPVLAAVAAPPVTVSTTKPAKAPVDIPLRVELNGLDARIDELAGQVLTLTEHLTAFLASAPSAKVDELLGKLEGFAEVMAFGRRLMTFFGPLVEEQMKKGAPVSTDDIATRAYVDQACLKLSTTLRQHVQQQLEKKPAKKAKPRRRR